MVPSANSVELKWDQCVREPKWLEPYREEYSFGQIAWPFTGDVRTEFWPRLGGYWPHNNTRRTAFRNRVYGGPGVAHVQGSEEKVKTFVTLHGASMGLHPPVRPMDEVQVLAEWLQARPAFRERIHKIEPLPRQSEHMPKGIWVRAEFRPMRDSREWANLGYHGTSLSNLARMARLGPCQGWTGVNGDKVLGVYMHAREGLHHCTTYSVYSALHRSGWYWAPYLEIRYNWYEGCGWRKNARYLGPKITANQYIAEAQNCDIVAVLFHGVSIANLMKDQKTTWLNMEIELPRDMEIGEDEAEEAIEARTFAKWMEWRSSNPTGQTRED